VYYNWKEDKLVGTSNIPGHQCSLEEEKEEEENDKEGIS